MLQQIVDSERAHGRARFDCGAAHMRQKHSIGQIAQCLRHQRFGFKDIESSPAQLAIFSASIKAASSTTDPRLTLINVPFGPRASNTSALTILWVEGPPGVMQISASQARAISVRLSK